jgi:hypothetical protein
MGRPYNTNGKNEETIDYRILCESQKEIDHLETQDVGGWIILKWISEWIILKWILEN